MVKVHPLRYALSLGADLAAISVLAYAGQKVYDFYYHNEGQSPLLPVLGLFVLSASVHGCARQLRGKDHPPSSPTLETKVDYQI